MLSLEKILDKMKSQIDANKEKIGTADISESSSDGTLTTGLVETSNEINNINLKMGTQVTYRVELQNNGDYYLYIDTQTPPEPEPESDDSEDNPEDTGDNTDNTGNDSNNDQNTEPEP